PDRVPARHAVLLPPARRERHGRSGASARRRVARRAVGRARLLPEPWRAGARVVAALRGARFVGAGRRAVRAWGGGVRAAGGQPGAPPARVRAGDAGLT